MNEHELEQFVLNYLANHPDAWIDFYELDAALAAHLKTRKESMGDEVRKSYLRGTIGHLLHYGSVIRDKKLAKYKIGDETMNLFTEQETKHS